MWGSGIDGAVNGQKELDSAAARRLDRSRGETKEIYIQRLKVRHPYPRSDRRRRRVSYRERDRGTDEANQSGKELMGEAGA